MVLHCYVLIKLLSTLGPPLGVAHGALPVWYLPYGGGSETLGRAVQHPDGLGLGFSLWLGFICLAWLNWLGLAWL